MSIYILGDIHGEYLILAKLLLKVGLIEYHPDESKDWLDCLKWKKGNADTLIQVGDMIDGCSGSIISYNFLKRLQEEARIEDGKVIRLLGNHELAYISPLKCTGMDQNTDLVLTNIIKQDILNGKILASYYWNGYFISHAGMSKNAWHVHTDMSYMSNKLNEILIQCIQYNDFNHEMFNIGKSRGGLSDNPGIFWADWNRDELADMKQIVGHTSVGKIEFRDNHINVDCGISRHAQQVYEILKYENQKFEVIKLMGKEN